MERGTEIQPSPETVDIASFRQSHGLSRMLLTNHFNEGASPQDINDDIPADLKTTLAKGSIKDRKKYWTNKGKYGQQMITWLRGDTSKTIQGMAEWGSTQKDPDVTTFLQHMGYLPADDASLSSRKDDIRHLVSTINNDLIGDDRLDVDTMSEDEINALYFYNAYLLPRGENAGQPGGTSQLLDHITDSALQIVDTSKGESEQVDDAVKILQKVAPLLMVTGEEAQHAFAAAIMAKIHAAKEMDHVKAAETQQSLGSHEQRVVRFIQQANGDIDEEGLEESIYDVQPLEPNTPYSLVGIMEMVPKPEARQEDNPQWWIGGEMLSQEDVLAGLTRDYDGLKGLQQPESFFLPHPNEQLRQEGYVWPNFQPINDINPDDNPNSRFGLLEGLTNNDSGLLALAGVSREKIQQQADLYKILGLAILQVHHQNPQLMRTFFENQSQPSLSVFVNNEIRRAQEFSARNILERYGLHIPTQESSLEENRAFDQEIQRLRSSNAEFERELTQALPTYLTKPLVETGDRLLVMSLEQNSVGVNFDSTLQGWRERLDSNELQDALESGQITLEQIHQLEFLAHAVNVPEIMKWLQKHPKEAEGPLPTDLATASREAEEVVIPESHNVVALMEKVSADVDRKTNPYFVEHTKAPADIVEGVGKEVGFDKLEQTKPVYVAYDTSVPAPSRVTINPDIFPADTDLGQTNARYQEAKSLRLMPTDADSYLFALAASSAENPQQQAELFEGLAQVVVETHLKDEGLFKRFLEVQQQPENEASLAILITDEQSVAGPQWDKERERLLEEKFGDNPPQTGTEEYVTFLAPLQRVFFQQIEGKPDRMLSFVPKEDQPFAVFRNELDLDATLAAWKGRFADLHEALATDPITLTSDQLRQLEFLAYSIDTTKVIEWLNGKTLDRATGRRTTPKLADGGAGDIMETTSVLDTQELERMEPPPVIDDTEANALGEFPKIDRDGVKEGTESAAIKYQEQRFYYLRALLLDWGNEERVGALQDAVGVFPLSDVGTFLNDTEKIATNPPDMWELDSIFQGNMSMYSFGKGKHAMRNIFGDLTISQSEAVHTLLQRYASQQMDEEFPLAMRLLGLRIPQKEWETEATSSRNRISESLQNTLLSLELQVQETSKKFSPEEREFLKTLLNKMPTRADQLMAILYYYTLWHERQGGNKQLGRKHLISDLRRTADKTRERLDGKDELEYFAPPQNSN